MDLQDIYLQAENIYKDSQNYKNKKEMNREQASYCGFQKLE